MLKFYYVFSDISERITNNIKAEEFILLNLYKLIDVFVSVNVIISEYAVEILSF